jgi:hypothetical protein
LKFGFWSWKNDDSRKAAKDAKVPQIPLFPPLSKGDERGISGFLCALEGVGSPNSKTPDPFTINFVEGVLLNISKVRI